MAGPTNDAVRRSLLIAPAVLLPLGFVILRTRLLPRSYGWFALACGFVSQALGELGLFSRVAFADIKPAVIALENLWLRSVAVMLVVIKNSDDARSGLTESLYAPTIEST